MFFLDPGLYVIGDPFCCLNSNLNMIREPGVYNYSDMEFIISKTGFEEGEIKDFEYTVYTILTGLLGIFPFQLCNEKSVYVLSKHGKIIEFFEPVYVDTYPGYFELLTIDYHLILNTTKEEYIEPEYI